MACFMNWSYIMVQLDQAQEKLKKHFLRKENIIDYLLAGGSIILFTVLVYLSVTILFTN